MKKVETLLMSGTDTGCEYIRTVENSRYAEMKLALTGPDRRIGRGRKKESPEVACYCNLKGLDVIQCENVNSSPCVERLNKAGADIGLVIDFGQILSGEVLNIFPGGCYNVHYSLLPDLRGASPVRYSLLRGYSETGVTLIKMSEEIDAGEIVFKKKVRIEKRDNYGILKEKLTGEGKRLVEKLLKYIYEGRDLPLSPQDVSKVTRAPKIEKKLCRLGFNSPAYEIENKVRALSPAPGCWCILKKENVRIKILRARAIDPAKETSGIPGEVIESSKKSFTVCAEKGAVEVLRVQKEGSRPMDTPVFLAGNPVNPGDIFE